MSGVCLTNSGWAKIVNQICVNGVKIIYAKQKRLCKETQENKKSKSKK